MNRRSAVKVDLSQGQLDKYLLELAWARQIEIELVGEGVRADKEMILP
jgi:hypothetical protein